MRSSEPVAPPKRKSEGTLVTPVPIIGALVATVLLAASAATAKEAPSAVVCGMSFGRPAERLCLSLDKRDRLRSLIEGSINDPFEMRTRPRPAPFYTVTFRYREDSRWNWSLIYVPSRRLIRETTPVGMVTPGKRSVYWRSVPMGVTTAFRTLDERIRPFPGPRRWG
jgi:hypothetical protein